MNRLIGIFLVAALSLVSADVLLANKVCLLRKTESAKCSARGLHLDETETASLKDLCQDDHAVNVLTTRGAKVSELPFDCAQNLTDSSFVWLAWNDFLAKVKPLTNGNGFREGNSYFGRNILNQEDESGEFCRIDLTTGHCVSPNVNQSQNVLATEVLVKRIPLIYDLKTRQATSWRNVTDGDMVLLTTNHLSNRKLTTQFVQKIVSYDLEREYQFDLPESLSKEVAVNVYDEAGRLNLRFDVGDAAKTLISKSVPAIKRMLPRTTIEVSVRGRNEHILSKLNADLITVFDRHDDEAIAARFTRNLLLNRIEIGVQDVTVEFGVFVKLDTITEIEDDDDYPVVEEEDANSNSTVVESTTEANPVVFFQPDVVYPGFRTVSTIGSMIFCTAFFSAMFDVARKLRKTYSAKKRGSYSVVQTQENHL